MMTAERVFIVVGAIVAVLLQVLIAPHIAIASAVPNFIVAFTIAVAVVRARSFGCVLPFVLGLAFDLMGGGPVGLMAFSLTLLSYLLSRFVDHVGNDSLFMALAFAAIGVLLVDLLYGVLLLLFGYNASFLDALVYRMAPCIVYDIVLTLLLCPLARRFLQPAVVVRGELTQLR